MKTKLQLKPNLLDYSSYGVKTGSLNSKNFPQDITEAKQIIKTAKENSFDILIVRVDSLDLVRQNILKRIGAKKFDTLVTFKREFKDLPEELLNEPVGFTLESSEHTKNEKDLERVKEISASAFVHNHRSQDEKLSSVGTQKFFSQWAENNAKENSSQVIIARVRDLLVGYVILLVHKNDEEFNGRARGIVDLIAVDEKYRGMGVGKALVLSSIEWFSKNVEVATVGTQEDNSAALLYQKCGFLEYKREDTYHLWLDNLTK